MIFTARKEPALAAIRNFRLEHGYAPSIRELATELGLKSTGFVHRLVKALEVDGKIITKPGRRRSIELIPEGPEMVVKLPPFLTLECRLVAAREGRAAEEVAISAVREGLSCSKSVPVSRETSKVA